MNERLVDVVLHRLADSGLSDRQADLVLAACQGEDALHQAVGGGGALRQAITPSQDGSFAEHAYLRSISVEGFRGIGPPVKLDLELGPGLTLVSGRNGSGKSSFAEAAEVLLTGDNKRWSGRPSLWAEGWRNLHHPRAEVAVELLVDGQPGTTTIRGSWPKGGDLRALTVTIQAAGQTRQTAPSLEPDGLIRTYRPFLSYNELGSMLEERPSDLYDALEAVLGLGDLVDATQRLRKQRLESEQAGKAVAKAVPALARRLDQLDDDRARRAHDAITTQRPDLDGLDALLAASASGADDDELGALRQLANVTGPDWRMAATAAIELRTAARDAEKAAITDAGRAREMANLLEAALGVYQHSGDRACPVCGTGSLDSAWREATNANVARLRTEATEAERANGKLRQAQALARHCLTGPPTILVCGVPGFDTSEAAAAWRQWAAYDGSDPAEFADHLDQAEAVTERVEELRRSAASEVARREDRWRPVARDLTTWIVDAHAARAADALGKELKKVEAWLRNTSANLRDERFTRIAEEARSLWALLRQQSSVELGRVELEGATTRRRVALDVTVDGTPAAALGVMSQGELHALALSLFLPRATSKESPFRFLVIDDPVQAMDPARVDGLARVLEKTARTHQVIVFSHDDRLRESLHRQQIPARVVSVTRRTNSHVAVEPTLDPVTQAIDDARALAMTSELPTSAARRVVPGFCRLALEAACMEVVRRRDLSAGIPHAAVEARLLAADRLSKRMALALHGDAKQTASIMDDVERRFGRSAADVVRRANKGSHQGDDGDLKGLVDNAERVARDLLRLSQ